MATTHARRIPRRMLSLAALLIALGAAIWAGTLVRHHLQGPQPEDVVRTATLAYADGDCSALRKVSAKPASVDCAAVDQVEKAYRDERLRPRTFTYALTFDDGDQARVRISYVSRGRALGEVVPLVREHGHWKVVGATNTAID